MQRNTSNSTKQIYSWLCEHDELTLIACREIELYEDLLSMGIEVQSINYDINFRNTDIICKDAIFDEVEFKGCVVHWNCEKTYPIGKVHSGTFILRGDNKEHNGDCNPIRSIEQLVTQNELSEVYDKYQDETHFYVYGRT